MNRLAGIIVAAAGFLVSILSILQVLPGLTTTGVLMILLGGLIIGLSFVDKPDSEGTERMSTGSTLVNVFFSPTEVFRNLRRHPRWLVALLTMSVMSATFTNLFITQLTPERIANYAIDKTKELPMMNDDARKQVEAGRADAIEQAKSPIGRTGQSINGFIGSMFWYAFLAAVFMLFAMAMGGSMNFWQAFSAVIYASFPVAVIRFVLGTTILFLKDPAEIHPILGQQALVQDNLNFLVSAAEHPIIYTLLGAFSLLAFYGIWLTATGLKNAGERVSGTVAWSAAIGLYIIGVLLLMTMAALFPSFLS
jgi:hypothetical protein